MDNNQKSSADHIIEHLNAIDIDGETMEYIVSGTFMREQLLKQLMMSASSSEINNIMEERKDFNNLITTDMKQFRINTTAFHEEDFTLYTDLNEEQITDVIAPIVKYERDSGESYNNDDLVNALIKAYPNNSISHYNEPETISI